MANKGIVYLGVLDGMEEEVIQLSFNEDGTLSSENDEFINALVESNGEVALDDDDIDIDRLFSLRDSDIEVFASVSEDDLWVSGVKH
jgi:hypothetical protein